MDVVVAGAITEEAFGALSNGSKDLALEKVLWTNTSFFGGAKGLPEPLVRRHSV